MLYQEMYIIVHGALYQNCADLKSLQYKVCTKVGMWCMVYGALHQKCADLVYDTKCVPKLLHGAFWCIAPEQW